MIRLIFNKTAIPRTTTREQWRDIWRWKRETEKKLAEQAAKHLEAVIMFGTSHPEILDRYMDRATNPPVMIYPPIEHEQFN